MSQSRLYFIGPAPPDGRDNLRPAPLRDSLTAVNRVDTCDMTDIPRRTSPAFMSSPSSAGAFPGCGRVPTNQLTLTVFDRIDGLRIELERNIHGWSLRIRHRHVAGRWVDCDFEYYEDLALAEVLDVVEAIEHTGGSA